MSSNSRWARAAWVALVAALSVTAVALVVSDGLQFDGRFGAASAVAPPFLSLTSKDVEVAMKMLQMAGHVRRPAAKNAAALRARFFSVSSAVAGVRCP